MKTAADRDRDTEDVGRLIRYAGAREVVSAERLEKARARVGEHWQGVVAMERRRRRQLRFRQFAIAASLVAAVGLAFLVWRPATGPVAPSVATVTRVIGDVRIDGALVSAGAVVAAESRIETTNDGRIALQLGAGQSLRVDTDTRLVVQASDRYALRQGGVYVDSGAEGSATPVFIETHLGTASDVGTQFQVRLADDTLSIGVREGLVELARLDASVVSVDVGSLYELTTSGEERKDRIDADDPIWSWATSISPEFDIDGRSLHSYLVWYARERGVRLEWDSTDSEANALRVRLSGSIGGLALEDGLAAVQRIAPFEYRLSDGVLRVRVD